MTPARSRALTIAHAVAIAVLGVAAVVNLVLGGVLANRSLPLGLGFAAVSALMLVGLWRSSRALVALAAVGLFAGPVLAQRMGAGVDPTAHLTTALGLAATYAVWLATRAHRPGAAAPDRPRVHRSHAGRAPAGRGNGED